MALAGEDDRKIVDWHRAGNDKNILHERNDAGY
jgi:hypothetical protein